MSQITWRGTWLSCWASILFARIVFNIMASSVEKLAANLPVDAFKHTSSFFQNEKLLLMKKKGDYPYDFMDSVEKFDDQQLPSKGDFYSQLNSEHVSYEQYQHAQ